MERQLERDEVVRASPHAKRVALGLVIAAAAIGAPVILLTRRYLDRLLRLAESDRNAAMAGFTTWVVPQLLVMAALAVVAGIWMARMGWQSVLAQRYPLADAWVIHDTPVRRGRSARRVGYWLTATGLLVAAFAAASTLMLLAFLL
jgi:hypothetical protein